MDIEFYYLKGLKQKIISPQCLRVKMALNHLKVSYQGIGVNLKDKEKFLKEQELIDLPVLIDGKWTIQGSWDIVCFLERNYVQPPTLLGGELGEAHLKFIQSWVDGILIPNIFVFIIKDFHNGLDSEDQVLFRKIEEERYGQSLELIQAENLENLEIFRSFLHPLRLTLVNQPFFSGEAPSFADYLIFSAFKWPMSRVH